MATSEKPGLIFWDPVTGCSRIDDDCRACWADEMSRQRNGLGYPTFINGFKPTEHPENLLIPHSWKYRHLVNVASTSEIFLDAFSSKFILQIFKVMNDTPECEYLVQTKNTKRMLKLSNKISWTENIWMGVTVTSPDNLERIDHLKNTDAKTKWVAFHPLRREIFPIDLSNIDWVVTGPAMLAQRIDLYNQRKKNIIDECKNKKIPFYDKVKKEFRTYDNFRKDRWPKDLKSIGVLSNEKISSALIYYNPQCDKILNKSFCGKIRDVIKEINQFVMNNPKDIIIGLAPEKNYFTKFDISIGMIADVQRASKQKVIEGYLSFAKQRGFDIVDKLKSLEKVSPIKEREKQFGKMLMVLAIFYISFCKTIEPSTK